MNYDVVAGHCSLTFERNCLVNAEVNGKFSEKGQLCHKSVEFLVFVFFLLFFLLFFVLLNVKLSRIAIFHVLFFPREHNRTSINPVN